VIVESIAMSADRLDRAWGHAPPRAGPSYVHHLCGVALQEGLMGDADDHKDPASRAISLGCSALTALASGSVRSSPSRRGRRGAGAKASSWIRTCTVARISSSVRPRSESGASRWSPSFSASAAGSRVRWRRGGALRAGGSWTTSLTCAAARTRYPSSTAPTPAGTPSPEPHLR
jgi:hypothetical protein